MEMPLKTILTCLIVLFLAEIQAQGLTCAESDPFCTGTIYNFPAGTSGDAESGPFYDCLSTQPAPAWYHMKIGNPGPITIYMYSTPLVDIDFVCWGPFPDPFGPCSGGLTSSKVVDCSYSIYPQEWCDIPNGQTGEYYILLITNYSEDPCNITFSQTAGAGSTDCSILPPLVTSDSPLCVGETLHLNAETIANATYAWTGPAGFSSTEQNPVIPNVTLDHAGDYACVITVFSQSSPPAITTVVINDLPDAALADNDTIVCPGDEAFMIIQLTGAGPFEMTYYDGAAYHTIPGLNGPVDTIIVNPPGPATYTLTQVSDTACTRILSGIVFQVNNHPVVSGVMTGGEVICPGDTAELVFNLTGTPPWEITFLANGMNPQTITAGYTPFSVFVTPLTTTTYLFSGLSDLYCTGSPSGQVEVVVDYPGGFLNGDNNICAGEGSELVFTLTGYPPWTLKYTINGGNEQTVVAPYSPFIVAVSPTESTLYEFTNLNDAYCAGSASGQAMVTVQQPTGELSGESTVCAGESATIVFNLTGNPPWTLSYSENGGTPVQLIAYSTPFPVVVSPSVTTIYTFVSFADVACTGIPSGEAVVTVNPLPAVSAGNDQTIPNGTSTSLDGSVSGGSGSYAFQWQPADKLLNSQVLQPVTVNLYSSTLFTLTITDNNGGCYDSDEVLVTITGGVLSCNATATPDLICRGETSQLMAIASGGSGNYTYAWSSDPPGFNSDIPNPVVSPAGTTSYSLVINDGYNVAQASAVVTVQQLPEPDAGPDQVITYGTITVLQGSAGSGSGNYFYHWEPGYLLDNPDIAQPTTVNLYETTLFTLSVTDAETGCICENTDNVAVIISGSALGVSPMASPDNVCAGGPVELHALAGGGTGLYTYSWASDPAGFTSSEPDPVVMPEMNTTYTVLVSDGFNSATGSVTVTVNPNPVVFLGNDTVVCVFDTITVDAGNPGASYYWYNGSTERMISIATTGIGYDSKTVSVTVTSAVGCVTTAQRVVAFDFVACSGIGDDMLQPQLQIFPNPGDGLILLKNTGEAGHYSFSVLNSHGKVLIDNKEISFFEGANHQVLDLRSNPPGLYMLKFQSPDDRLFIVKYILKN